jgi:hypothetical protein
MSRWWVKAAIQRGISLLPGRNYWNEWFQEHVTRSVECTESRFESQLKKSRAHLVEEVATRGDAEALARIRLAPRFARYDPIDLQVI